MATESIEYPDTDMMKKLMKPEFQGIDGNTLLDVMQQYKRQRENMYMHQASVDRVPDPFHSLWQLKEMDGLAHPGGPHYPTADGLFESMTKTADAFKDVCAWMQAQVTMIKHTYGDDPHRMHLHMYVLIEGFKALLKKEKE